MMNQMADRMVRMKPMEQANDTSQNNASLDRSDQALQTPYQQ